MKNPSKISHRNKCEKWLIDLTTEKEEQEENEDDENVRVQLE
jgi:hypothetical protein